MHLTPRVLFLVCILAWLIGSAKNGEKTLSIRVAPPIQVSIAIKKHSASIVMIRDILFFSYVLLCSEFWRQNYPKMFISIMENT